MAQDTCVFSVHINQEFDWIHCIPKIFRYLCNFLRKNSVKIATKTSECIKTDIFEQKEI